MSKHLGDFDTSTVVYGKFTTFRPSTGAAYTLGGTPALSVYKDNSTTQSTTGVTLTADFDSVTGLNHFAIDTSADGTFYSSGSFFDVVITTGTVDSVSVVGAVVGSFTLRKTSTLKPTTAGRTLDVSAGGEAGLDWANVGSPTTSLALTGTTIATTQKVDIETIKTNPVVNAGTVTFPTTATLASTTNITAATGITVATNNDKTGYSLTQTFPSNFSALSITAGGVAKADLDTIKTQTVTCAGGVTIPAATLASTTNITAGTITTVTNLTNAPTSGDLTATMKASVNAEVDTALVDIGLDHLLSASVAGTDVTDNSIIAKLVSKSATADWDTYVNTTDSHEALRDRGDAAWITAVGFSTHSASDVWAVATRVLTAATNISGPIADQVWEEAVADHSGTSGSTAESLNAAGSAGDPWTTALPGAYSSGQAGNIIGNLSVPTATSIADAVLSRSASNVEDTAAEHTLCGVILAMMEHSISGTTLTIKKTDGSTTFTTKTLTTNPAAEPITGID